MSLPDTIFIFVLALIIFGPKKLPEIGRQLGKLVGEFRRASNEFKFQIEEELRQADFTDKYDKQRTIAAPVQEPAALAATVDSSTVIDPVDHLPVGQHPNIDSVNTTELNEFGVPAFGYNSAETDLVETERASEPAAANPPEPIPDEPSLTVTPAAGTQARTSIPFAPVEATPSAESTVPLDPHPAATEAEISHG